MDDILKNLFEIDGLIAIASKETNFSIYDFDFRQYFETKSIFSGTSLPVVLRIGAIKNYKETFEELERIGLRLINSIDQHETASLLPDWYPKIKNYTAKSKVYETMPEVEDIMVDFEFPVFIKGERQTNKHKRNLCIAENKDELRYIMQMWKADPILNWQRVICREFIKLEKIDSNHDNQLQLSNEHRVFLWKHKVVGIGQYWTEARQIVLTYLEKEEITWLSEQVANLVNVPFLVVDIGKQENGKWIVIELNDAQESGYAGVSKLKLWETILETERWVN